VSVTEILTPDSDREIIERTKRLVKSTREMGKMMGSSAPTVSFPCDIAERLCTLAENGLRPRP
jgi:hypothetical protein